MTWNDSRGIGISSNSSKPFRYCFLDRHSRIKVKQVTCRKFSAAHYCRYFMIPCISPAVSGDRCLFRAGSVAWRRRRCKTSPVDRPWRRSDPPCCRSAARRASWWRAYVAFVRRVSTRQPVRAGAVTNWLRWDGMVETFDPRSETGWRQYATLVSWEYLVTGYGFANYCGLNLRNNSVRLWTFIVISKQLNCCRVRLIC